MGSPVLITPGKRKLADETSATLADQQKNQGTQFNIEQQYLGKYAGLQNDAIQSQLGGANGFLNYGATTVNPALQGQLGQGNAWQNQETLGNLQKYGGALVNAQRDANPELGNLQRTIGAQTQADLALGRQASSAQLRDAGQSARQAYAARGMVMSNPAISSEILNRYNVGEQRYQQRLGNAQSAGQFLSQTSLDPYAAINNSQNQAAGLMNQGTNLQMGMRGNYGPKLSDPYAKYAEDLYNTNFNAEESAKIANAQAINAANTAKSGMWSKVAMGVGGAMFGPLGAMAGNALVGAAMKNDTLAGYAKAGQSLKLGGE